MSYESDTLRNLSYRIQELAGLKYELQKHTDAVDFNSMISLLNNGIITKSELENSELYVKYLERNRDRRNHK